MLSRHHLFVRDDADDLPWHLRAKLALAGDDLLDEHVLANWILIGELLLGERLVDDHHGESAFRVALGKPATFSELHARARRNSQA